MNKKPIIKIFSLSSSQSLLEWESLFGDKYKDAADFSLINTNSPEDADVIVWDGILNPKSRNTVEILRPLLDRGIPLILTGERRAFLEESHVAEAVLSSSWKTIALPPWGSVPEDLLLSLSQVVKGRGHV